MSGEIAVILDWLSEMWSVQYYRVVISMILFWLIYLKTKIACLVDFGWCFNHLLVGISLYLTNNIQQFFIKPLIFSILLFLWFLRLGGFLMIYRIIPGHEDPRYQKLQAENQTNPIIYFFINYQLQGFFVMWTATPLYFVFRKPDYINYSFYVSIVVIVIGILFEAIADQQLQNYKDLRKKNINQQQLVSDQNEKEINGNQKINYEKELRVLNSGLWKKSRHPNLFFEFLTWIGFAIGGLNDYISILGFMGPIFLFIIVDRLTLPLTEKHMKESRGELYEQFCKDTNKYFPL